MNQKKELSFRKNIPLRGNSKEENTKDKLQHEH